MLTGPPGIGKTHLVRQLAGELPEGVRMVRACGRERERRFGPLLTAARELHGPGLEESAGGGQEASGVSEEARLAERIVDLFRQEAGRSPWILGCDDLESFDAASLACVLSLLWRMDRLPFSLLLVREEGAVQPPEVARLWKGVDEAAGKPVRWFRVPPLTAAEAEGVCRARLGGALRFGGANLQWLLRISGGNPRYLGEILDYLRDTAWLTRTADGWRLVVGAPGSPPALDDLVRRRVDAATAREPAGARSLLEYGAARGLRFETALVAAAAGWEAERAVPVLQRLGERTGYLLPLTAEGGGFELDHELTRQGVLAGLGGERRRGVHLRLALAQEAAHEVERAPSYELLAGLYEGAGEWRHAAEECGLAAVEALARGFPNEAARLARWQDALLERAGERREEAARLAVAETRGEGLVAAGRAAEAVAVLQPLAAAAARERRPRLLHLLGAATARLPEEDAAAQALRWLRRAREVEDPAAQPGLAARILLETAVACQAGGDLLGARKAQGRAMDAARRAGDLALQLHLLRLCRRYLEADTALRHLENAVALARQQGRELDEALCLNNLGTVCAELGRLAEARDHWTSGLEILSASGPWGTALPLANLAFLAFAHGDVEAAGELLEQARAVAWEPAVALPVRCQQAVVRAVQGEPEEAVRELRALAAEAERLGERESRARILFNLARALLEAGRPEEALPAALLPPPWLGSDRDLAESSLARLRLEASARLHLRPEAGLQRQARVLERNTKIQAWLYRLPWARGDVQFR